MQETVAITGGTGFIGTAVVGALLRQGFRVRALLRPGRARPVDLPRGVEVLHGALDGATPWRQLLAGTRVVVNCAGVVRGAHPQAFTPVNVRAVGDLAGAAHSCGVRVVHLSSLAARQAQLSDYSASKAAGEAELVASGVDFSALRPPAVYGPGDRELRGLLRSMHRGLAVIPAAPGARFSLIYVDDLAEAVLALVQAPAAGGIFELDDGQPGGYGWEDLASAMALIRGGRVRLVRAPAVLLRSVATVNALLARRTGRAPMLTPGKVRELLWQDWAADGHAFAEHTGWRARISLDEGLKRTCAGL